jgi:hypothetical protein
MERFMALLVEPDVVYGGHAVVEVRDADVVRCAGVQVGAGLVAPPLLLPSSGSSNGSGGAGVDTVDAESTRGSSSSNGKRRAAPLPPGGDDERSHIRARVLSVGAGQQQSQPQQAQPQQQQPRRGHAQQAVACLATLGAKFGESYDDWMSVLFAVRNETNSALGGGGGTDAGLDAFVEWRHVCLLTCSCLCLLAD